MDARLLERITIEPGKCGGRPCVRGMRIRVSDILEMLGNGVSMEEVLNDFPDLEREDILAYSAETGHPFHLKLDTQSTAKWTVGAKRRMGWLMFTPGWGRPSILL